MTTTTNNTKIRTHLFTIELLIMETGTLKTARSVQQRAEASAGNAHRAAAEIALEEDWIEPDDSRLREIEKLGVGDQHWIYTGEGIGGSRYTLVTRIR